MLKRARVTLIRRARERLSEFPPSWFFGLIVVGILGLTGLFLLFSRINPLGQGAQTGFLVGATVGFLIGLAGIPTGFLAVCLVRFGVGRAVVSESMSRAAQLGVRVLVFSVAVLAGLLFASGSDPVAFPWLMVGLGIGTFAGLLVVLMPVFTLAAMLGMVLGLPVAILLDRYVGEGERRRKPFWATRQRLANRFWRPRGGDDAEPLSTAGCETVVFVADDPLGVAPTMLDFIEKGYQVSFATPERALRGEQLPQNPRLFVAPRSVLAPWMSRNGRPTPSALAASKLVAGLAATYPRAKFLLVEDDEVARKLGAPLLTYHAHASIDDGAELLIAARTALGRHAPVRRLRVVDWIERHLLPDASGPPTPPEVRLKQAGILEVGEPLPSQPVNVQRTDDVSIAGIGVAIYEIPSWEGWEAAEAQIRADGAAAAILCGHHDMQDGGWMVYLDGENRGEVGSLALARGLLRELHDGGMDTAG